jgi:hypothetical protein
MLEGAKQQELKILLRELKDRALEGPLDVNKPPPAGYGTTERLWRPGIYETGPPPMSYDYDIEAPAPDFAETPGGSEARARWEEAREKIEKAKEEKRQAEQRKEEDRLASWRQWETEEKIRFEALKQKAELDALSRAEKKIPSSIDISLLGGGWAFLLEFSTVIVIIFTLLILGILKILEGREIATILAAIAGYVLGKATSAAKQSEKPAETAPSTPGGK